MTTPDALALCGVSKRFGTVDALASADFQLRPGAVHALVGENGAGKTTLMRIAFGLLQPDAGVLRLDGKPATLRSPRHATRAGIGMVQQHFSLVPALTAGENIALGSAGRFHPARAAELAHRAAADAGFDLDPHAIVAELGIQAQQRVAIVRALAHGARILILDEPTAVLAPDEAAALFTWIRRFADRGGAVALVTHKVREALQVADEITVLRGGRVVATGASSAFDEATLARAMFPATASDADTLPRQPRSPGPIVVSATALTLKGPDGRIAVREATFEIRRGELVGILGVEGAGQAELLRALAGLQTPATGTFTVSGTISFVPADRHRDAVIPDFPLFENLALHRAAFQRGFMNWPAWRQRTSSLLAQFDIRAPSEGAPLRTLSGGNQQRFVLARELEPHPDLLIAENPTRGLDLQATRAIFSRLHDAASRGTAVLLYSSDLDEVLPHVDRVFVAYSGTVRSVPPVRSTVSKALVGLWE